jgi:hypothetical protein
LNVPLPITLPSCRADSVWFHELGTHFLRNAINEPQRRASVIGGDRGRPASVPFGAGAGLTAHMARMKGGRTQVHLVPSP